MFGLVRQVHVKAVDSERIMWLLNAVPISLWDKTRANADLFCYMTGLCNSIEKNTTNN